MKVGKKTDFRMDGNFSRLNRKGFTLIELLAVIIILGVLMIIAIPSVTEYISNSRKNAYITIATRYIDGVRGIVNSGNLNTYDKETTYYIPGSCVSLERGGESPYGDFEDLYVVVTYNGSGYDYYFTSRDETNMGIYLTYQDLLNIDEIKSGVTSIRTDVGVGERERILLLDDTCDVNTATEIVATSNILEKSKIGKTLFEQITDDNDTPLDNVASTYVTSSTGINFAEISSDTNGKGLYIRSGTENTANPIYYYRGAVTNNNVIFGSFCWKIVRTTEKGGTKLIYNGVPTDGKCNNTGTSSQIGTSKFNPVDTDNTYVGYMYGSANASTYDEAHANQNDSTIKTYIDTWYSNNMDQYTSYLEDTVWCNDRSMYRGAGITTRQTTYNAYLRNYARQEPSLLCINKNDSFTVNDINGNSALTYPVGLLTADELTLSGFSGKTTNRSTYLYTGTLWYSMSPSKYEAGALEMEINANFLTGVYVKDLRGVRPSISLKSGAVVTDDGEGTQDNPYVIVTNK